MFRFRLLLLCIIVLFIFIFTICTLSRCGLSTWIKVLIDWLIDSRWVVAVYYKSIYCNPLTPLDLLWLCRTPCFYTLQDFDRRSASRGASAVQKTFLSNKHYRKPLSARTEMHTPDRLLYLDHWKMIESGYSVLYVIIIVTDTATTWGLPDFRSSLSSQ